MKNIIKPIGIVKRIIRLQKGVLPSALSSVVTPVSNYASIWSSCAKYGWPIIGLHTHSTSTLNSLIMQNQERDLVTHM